MTHGQSAGDIPDVKTPIVAEKPEQITALDAFKAQLLKECTDSKYLHVSPTLRKAGRAEWLKMEAELEGEWRSRVYLNAKLNKTLAELEELYEQMVDAGLMYKEDGQYYDK